MFNPSETPTPLVGISFVRVTEKTLRTLIPIVLESWQDPTQTSENARELLLSILDSERRSALYMAVEKGQAIGYTQIAIRYEYAEGATVYPVASLRTLYVQKRDDARPIALQLIKLAEGYVHQFGIREFVSDCERSDIQTYEYLTYAGYREVSERIHFHKRTDEPAPFS